MTPRIPFALLGLLALAGCARHETRVAEGNRTQTLLIGNKDEPSDIDPATNEAITTSRIMNALFEGLVTYNDAGSDVVPAGADRWTISADGLTYTFHLREAARFSNGEPVTAQAYRDSFLRVLDPQIASPQSGPAFCIAGAQDYVTGHAPDASQVGILAPDPHTLVLRLAYPAPYLLKVLAWDPFYPLYLPSLDAHGGRRVRGGSWSAPGVLVSNGPFVLSAWKPNAYVSVTRNPQYWDAARIRLKEVRFVPTDDEGAEERDFRSGELHLTYRVPETKVAAYAADHPDELHLQPILRTDFISFNLQRAPFRDARVRRALSLAVDRVRLVHAALGQLGVPATTWVRPGTGGFQPTPRFHFDPVAAAAELAAAGFPKGAGFPVVELTLNGTTGSTLAVAEVLQQMWKDNLGIRVELHPMEFKAYLAADTAKDFAFLLEGYSTFPDPHDMLSWGARDDPNNDASVDDPEYERAYRASDRVADPVLRLAACDAVEAINARQVYYLPLYYVNRGSLISTSVRGWHDHGVAAINWRDLYLQP